MAGDCLITANRHGSWLTQGTGPCLSQIDTPLKAKEIMSASIQWSGKGKLDS